MNKTIIININGTIFHIEEDAYEALKNYITAIKRHFADAEDSLEITTDIENRIAEMFTEILTREARQVVVMADVDHVTAQMGTAEDFETTANETDAEFTSANGYSDHRKLFRDPDDYLIGGVCSGIASYFDVESMWVRLAFVIATAIGGSGMLIYIILWLILPKAETRADRMAMKGEKLDLQGFRKNFEDELKNVRHTLRDAHNGARPFIYKLRDFIGDFFEHLGRFLNGAGKLVMKLIGVLILLMCFGFLIAVIVGFVCVLAYGTDIYHIFPISAINRGYHAIYVSAFAVVFLPLLAIILLTLKLIFKGNAIGRSTASTMLALWIAAICVLTYYGVKISAEFRETASFSQTINLKPNMSNVYHLKLSEIKYLSKDDSLRMGIDSRFKGHLRLDGDDNDPAPRNVSINIEQGDVNQLTLVETFSAKGAHYENALRNARNAVYYFSQHDSLLTLDRRVRIPNGSLWRDQTVELTLKVPNNAEVVVDQNLNGMLRNGIDIYDCKHKNKMPSWHTAPFIMTDGEMQCKVDTAFGPFPAIQNPGR